jgi:hypothetical protein
LLCVVDALTKLITLAVQFAKPAKSVIYRGAIFSKVVTESEHVEVGYSDLGVVVLTPWIQRGWSGLHAVFCVRFPAKSSHAVV